MRSCVQGKSIKIQKYRIESFKFRIKINMYIAPQETFILTECRKSSIFVEKKNLKIFDFRFSFFLHLLFCFVDIDNACHDI